MEMRQATVTDAAAILALTREAYAKWVPVIGREPKPMNVDYAEALRRHRFDVLCENTETLAALIETVRRPAHLLVVNLAVSPAFRDRGLGRRLMAHAEDLALAARLYEVRLHTNKAFQDSILFYGQLGYRPRPPAQGQAPFILSMSKQLPP